MLIPGDAHTPVHTDPGVVRRPQSRGGLARSKRPS